MTKEFEIYCKGLIFHCTYRENIIEHPRLIRFATYLEPEEWTEGKIEYYTEIESIFDEDTFEEISIDKITEGNKMEALIMVRTYLTEMEEEPKITIYL